LHNGLKLRQYNDLHKDPYSLLYLSILLYSYTLYSVFNATLHIQLRIPLFYFMTCFSHKRPSSCVLVAKTVTL
jgi:hypothetical protein